MIRARIVAAAALVLVAAEHDAHAGNVDSFYFSDDAAMTAGAVVSVTRDAGAIFYNPAGLGGNDRGEVDFNGTALAIRIRPVSNALTTLVPGSADNHATPLNAADFFSTPHALTLIRNITPKLSAGFGLYVVASDIHNAETQRTFAGTSPASGGTAPGSYQQRLDYALQAVAYRVGPAVGYEIEPYLRVGATLFGTYGKGAGFSQYLAAFHSSDSPSTTVGSILAQDRELLTYLGVQLQAGVQYDMLANWHLGLLVRSPEVIITSSDDGAQLETTGLIAPGQPGKQAFVLQNPKAPFKTFDVFSPMRVIASVSHDFAPRTWIALEADFQTGVSTAGIDDKVTVNARVGGRYAVSEKLGVGAGLFTDRSSLAGVPTSLGGDRVDYYGLTGGIELLTPLALREKKGPSSLILSTTLALRYAIGLGSARAADIDLTPTGGATPPRVVSVTYHEIIPYIGSGVLF